ncbi:MAG: ATP-binding cassette domain-containing protein, partial [Alloalcanivorax xenomutans]
MLKLENVDAKYDSFKALDNVSMTVGQGELVVLLGANGAGKTTLFNTISGLLKPSAGSITLNGEDVTGRRPSALVQAGVVQCPEGRKLFP